MEKPDANGVVNVTWPSKSIPHGGIFHTRVVQPSAAQQEFLKVLLEESKLTIDQRRKSGLALREYGNKDAVHRCEVPTVRPRTSRRRSLSAIRESGVLEMDGGRHTPYCPNAGHIVYQAGQVRVGRLHTPLRTLWRTLRIPHDVFLHRRKYRPLKRGEDRELLKERLANAMAYGTGDDQQRVPPATRPRKPPPKLPTKKETWNDLVTQIRERAEWLAEMEDLGEAGPHREMVKDQIADRLRALDALGIDSVCSSARSSKSGFSILNYNPKSERSNGSAAKSETSNKSLANKINKDNVRKQAREENVMAYNKLSPLQYTPRRRV